MHNPEPEFSESHADSALRRGQLLYDHHKYEQAQVQFVEHLRSHPEDAETLAYISLCLLARGQKRKASQLAAQAVAADPSSTLAYTAAARAFRDRKMNKEATRALNEALKLEPERPDLLGLAAMLACDRRAWNEALALTARGLEQDPSSVNCRLASAWALMHSKRLPEARDLLHSILRDHPEESEALAGLGWTALREGKRDEALEQFSAALRIDPENEAAREGFMDALRSRYPVYGLVVRYLFWMQSLPSRSRWGLMIAEQLVEKGLGELARRYSVLRPLVRLILLSWSIFSYLTWIARPITNGLLRFNSHARRFLRADEVQESSCIAAALLSMGLSYWQWTANGQRWALVTGIVAFSLMIPITAAYSAPEGWPRKLMKGFALALLSVGLAAAWNFYEHPLTGGHGLFLIRLYVGMLMVNQLMAFFVDRVDTE